MPTSRCLRTGRWRRRARATAAGPRRAGGDAVGSSLRAVHGGGGQDMFFGVIRPGWDVEGGGDAYMWTATASTTRPGPAAPAPRLGGDAGREEQGDRIGMLLDLDQGSMSVWKNGELLGVMQAEGLSGPLCWAVELYQATARASNPRRRRHRRRRRSWRRRRRGNAELGWACCSRRRTPSALQRHRVVRAITDMSGTRSPDISAAAAL